MTQIIDFALGEVQTLEAQTPWTRHAVVQARPSDWARAICPAEPLVWVHEVAGAPIPFPGPFGFAEPGTACPDCTTLIASTNRDRAPRQTPAGQHPWRL